MASDQPPKSPMDGEIVDQRIRYSLARDGLEIVAKLAAKSSPETRYAMGASDGPITAEDLDRALVAGKGPVWYVWTGTKEDALYVAVTGNGPTSEKNAIFFANARDIVLELVDAVEELRGRLKNAEEALAKRVRT